MSDLRQMMTWKPTHFINYCNFDDKLSGMTNQDELYDTINQKI